MNARTTRSPLAAAAALTISIALPTAAHAESHFVSAGGPLSVSARLDFQVFVPKILFLQVGTGANYTNNGTIDLIAFSVPGANIGDGTPVAATAGSGDVGNGVVSARVQGNNGTVTLTSTTTGPLSNGAGDTISFGQISAAASVWVSATALAHPTLVDGGTTSTTVPAVGKVVNRDARWTFTYLNSNVVAPGTYGGINVNNGRVTYTASMP
jgi:hypothetical protein